MKGFRDFPPDVLARRRVVFDAWRRVARRYGFREYDAPPLELLDLYVEKSGSEIVGQLYAFKDKGGRRVALRPEMTPSLARMLADRSRAMPKPIRWFSIPQLFRYERQQRGRLREHYQWNVDIVGEQGPGADAEVIAVAIDGLRELGLGAADFRARVSHRGLLTALLEAAGVPPDCRAQALAVVDKLDRTPTEVSLDQLRTRAGMTSSSAAELLELLGASDQIDAARSFLGRASADRDRAEQADEALVAVQDCLARLDALGLSEFVEIDLSIVRGLDYYTGTVFELFDVNRELRAICGGGRYDRLLELVGGEPLAAAGFGMGDVVLGELLVDRDLAVPESVRVDFAMIAVPEGPATGGEDRWLESRSAALELAARLRKRNRSVVYSFGALGVGRQLKAAERQGARVAISIGPEERKQGTVRVRDMNAGRELELGVERLVELVGGHDPAELVGVALENRTRL